jgi:hypothetical protein
MSPAADRTRQFGARQLRRPQQATSRLRRLAHKRYHKPHTETSLRLDFRPYFRREDEQKSFTTRREVDFCGGVL